MYYRVATTKKRSAAMKEKSEELFESTKSENEPDIESDKFNEMSDDEKIDFAAARILKRYRSAFLELAK